MPTLPIAAAPDRDDPFEIAALSLPARAYTGDFYFSRRVGGTLWFALGDVAGKGIASAVFMAMIQETLEHLLGGPSTRAAAGSDDPCSEPCGVLHELDAMLQGELPANRFATVVVGSLDPAGVLTVANGGHCPPLIRRGDGAVEALPPNGPALGILPGRCWGVTTARLVPGDSVLLYTDGLSEVTAGDGCEFGDRGIATALAAAGGAGASVLQGVLESAQRHGRIADDLTLLILRYRPWANSTASFPISASLRPGSGV